MKIVGGKFVGIGSFACQTKSSNQDPTKFTEKSLTSTPGSRCKSCGRGLAFVHRAPGMVGCGFSAPTVSPDRRSELPGLHLGLGQSGSQWRGPAPETRHPRYGWEVTVLGGSMVKRVKRKLMMVDDGSRFVGWQSVKDEFSSILQAGWWLKLKHSCLWRHWCSVWRRQEGPTARCLTVSLWTVCMFLFLHDIVFNLSLRTFLKQKRLEIILVEQPFSSGIFYVNLMISSWQRALLHSQQKPPIIGAANL